MAVLSKCHRLPVGCLRAPWQRRPWDTCSETWTPASPLAHWARVFLLGTHALGSAQCLLEFGLLTTERWSTCSGPLYAETALETALLFIGLISILTIFEN